MDNIPERSVETLLGQSNWTVWKCHFLSLLCQLGYQSSIMDENSKQPDGAVANNAARAILLNSVGSEPRTHLSHCMTAKEMWDKLKIAYQPTAADVYDQQFEKLFQFLKSDQESIVTHARKLRKIFDDLNKQLKREIKIFIPQCVLIDKILKTLPENYCNFPGQWAKLSKNQQNVFNLIGQLRLFQRQFLERQQDEQCGSEDSSDSSDNLIDHENDKMEGVFTVVQFICAPCSKVYETEKKYQTHVRRIHKEKDYSCATCEKKFAFLHKLKNHERSHSVSKIYLVVCSVCGKGLSRTDKLRSHMVRYHGENNSVRTEPELKTPCKKRVKLDKMSEGQLAKFTYKCDRCMVGYQRRGILVNHMAKRHPEVALNSIPCLAAPIFEVQQSFKCHYCEKTYMSHGKRKAHIKTNHPQSHLPFASRYVDINDVGTLEVNPRKCSFCPKQFLTNAKLLQHTRKAHPLEVFQNDNVEENDLSA